MNEEHSRSVIHSRAVVHSVLDAVGLTSLTPIFKHPTADIVSFYGSNEMVNTSGKFKKTLSS